MKKTVTTKFLMMALFAAAVFQATAQWEEMAPMPTPRSMAASCVLDGKVFVIGGTFAYDGPSTSVVEVYDPETNTWDTSMPGLPMALCGSAACVYDGKIYVMGGGAAFLGEGYSSTFVYDPYIGEWQSLSDMPYSKNRVGAVTIDDKIYVAGGFEHSLLIFDPVTNEWSEGPDMPTPRAFQSVETFDGKVYVMGGAHLGITKSEVEVYDPISGSWTAVANMPDTRFYFGTGIVETQIGSQFYAFAGGKDFQTGLSRTWRYDPVTDEWFVLHYMYDFPDGIIAPASVVAEDPSGKECLYSFGGALTDFWVGGTGPKVSGTVYKLFPVIVSTEDLGSQSAPAVLYPNNPNPFNTNTLIRYELQRAGNLSINIYNLDGKTMVGVWSGFQQPGVHEIEWNAEALPAGLYVLSLQMDGFTVERKVVVQ